MSDLEMEMPRALTLEGYRRLSEDAQEQTTGAVEPAGQPARAPEQTAAEPVVAIVFDESRMACKGVPELFFEPSHIERSDEKSDREDRAKAVCRGCVNLVPCLEGALERKEKFGIWGGKTEKELRKIMKTRKQG